MSDTTKDRRDAELDLDAVREQIQSFVVTHPFDWRDIARKIGVPMSKLKSFLQCNKGADERRVARKVKRLLASGVTGSRLPFLEPEFVDTVAAREVTGALDLARESGLMVLVLGESGVGKSRAARHYVDADDGGPWIWEDRRPVYMAARAGMSPKDFIGAVADACGAGTWGNNMGRMQDAITEWLDEPGRLLVIDESDVVTHQGFHALRQCWDRASGGLAFLGTSGWIQTLKRGKRKIGMLPQFLSRFGYYVRIPRLDDEDVEAVLEQYDLSDSARDAAVCGAEGNVRRAVSACRLASEIGDGMMSAARIKAAFSRLAPVV